MQDAILHLRKAIIIEDGLYSGPLAKHKPASCYGSFQFKQQVKCSSTTITLKI